MDQQQFVETFMEGVAQSGSPVYEKVTENLTILLYQTRLQLRKLKDQIEEMDDIARNNTIEVRCRSCQQDYVPDCELSEIVGSELYCGKNEWCTP